MDHSPLQKAVEELQHHTFKADFAIEVIFLISFHTLLLVTTVCALWFYHVSPDQVVSYYHNNPFFVFLRSSYSAAENIIGITPIVALTLYFITVRKIYHVTFRAYFWNTPSKEYQKRLDRVTKEND
ncbi:TPA: hypothetical protein NJ811_004720 [Vibrio parahaemolyticus]|uniref:hypothetical protein n=1 Tax=Vibrio fluvialis TaxID=676 RepID=UPI00096B8D98|nr:hypothetical protein [Vibrio fluvialis]MBY7818566.1 hypothetical protein [Vibrio fluvialis]HCG9432667.1 hypothetical protein [Vibrio parahaemolyticus]HCG9631130.1 hypothetical protein [Vibrio parahaemolyticus]HCH3558366.1 hypothetical protein [Vibrio parahaemolyticus]